MMERPYKIVVSWCIYFFILAGIMLLFSEYIKQNEILTLLLVGLMFVSMFVSPALGLWFLQATKEKPVAR